MCRAAAIDGTAVFEMVVSSDSMKNATATSQGKRVFTDRNSVLSLVDAPVLRSNLFRMVLSDCPSALAAADAAAPPRIAAAS